MKTLRLLHTLHPLLTVSSLATSVSISYPIAAATQMPSEYPSTSSPRPSDTVKLVLLLCAKVLWLVVGMFIKW